MNLMGQPQLPRPFSGMFQAKTADSIGGPVMSLFSHSLPFTSRTLAESAIKALGGWDTLLAALVTFILLDSLSGLIRAAAQKKFSLKSVVFGSLKKVMIFIVVIASCTLEKILGGELALREVVIFFFLSNEGLSLIENASAFLPIPRKLREVLLQLRQKEDQ